MAALGWIMNLGFAGGTSAVAEGPWRVAVADVYIAGQQEAEAFTAGMQTGDVLVAGQQEADAFTAGMQTGDVLVAGAEEAEAHG